MKKFTWVFILLLVMVAGYSVGQGIANITAEWSSGDLVYKNADTKASILTVGTTGITQHKGFTYTSSAVALVSPAVTFSAAGKGLITLTADADLTGIYPTGGVVGQVIVIVPGAGANTMRFDNGAKTVLGANITLTEGNAYEGIALRCTSSAGDVWALCGLVPYGAGSFTTITASGAAALAGAVTLDDGSGASPNLTLQDATDETAVFSKADSGFLGLTTLAADGFNMLVGNVKIGNGTPGVTQDGEDFYCEGTGEFAGSVTLDDGTGASPSLTFQDATDETAVFSKADAGFLGLTTVAGDGLNILVGNFKVGNGTPDTAQDGEDGYVEGFFENDGGARFDGDLALNGTITRAAQVFTFTQGKAGATAGWVVAAGANLWSTTLPASQTGSTLVFPITGLHVGDIITKVNLIGQVESAGANVVISADFRKLTTGAADLTDASVGTIAEATLTADTALSGTNAATGALNETVGADETFYLLVTGTTAGATDIDLQGCQVTVTQK